MKPSRTPSETDDTAEASVQRSTADAPATSVDATTNGKSKPLKDKTKVPLAKPKRTRRIVRRCNMLTGKQWLQNSISVWSDIRKTTRDQSGNHPAQFPVSLLEKLIETFLPVEGELVLDPFCGSGTTLLVAGMQNQSALGLELSTEYCESTNDRLQQLSDEQRSQVVCHQARAQDVMDYAKPNSVDLCITSPPYWNVLNQPRSADYKKQRHYGNLDGDLGLIEKYDDYLVALSSIFEKVYDTLKPGAFCIVVVMDLRKRSQFYPLHSDLAQRMTGLGYIFDDLIIWNRQYDYNNLRPLGFPAVFRVNKVHEYILLFQKPRQ
ncbi:Modification methylase DpnIIB [Polystyrenella longa]|uniref:Methyltransferase n=1 Tax=Polystyrenella longa TaxID=2528007 RepID=A0A518CQL3_9PLAN|nr:site-specific DNA-methyltransferase [Polystyrenella longa]QDU81519.1 Modification methylase DpnIIB [Polystyrenella longa]